MKVKLHYFTALIASFLFVVSGIFSVIGLTGLFSGEKIIVALAIVLEFAKVVIVSFLYRRWKEISKIWKGYLIPATIALMLINALGVYGFLISSYQRTSGKIQVATKTTDIKNLQKNDVDTRIRELQEQSTLAQGRYKSLTETRQNQEKRLSDAMEKNMSRKMINGLRDDIKDTNKEMEELGQNRQKTNTEIVRLMDKRSTIQKEIIDASKDTQKIDLGTLKYLSKIFNRDMDDIANIIIILLVLLIDPLAIVLLLATNMNAEKLNYSKKDVIIKKDKQMKKRKPRTEKRIQYVNVTPLERLLWGNYREEEKSQERGKINVK